MNQPQTPAVSGIYIQNACVNLTQLDCMDNLESSFYDDASLIGDCYQKCPIECTEVKYDLTISSSTYPTEWYAKVLTNNTKFNTLINKYFDLVNVPFINYTNDYAGLKNSILRVNIFYEDLRYTLVEDSPAINLVMLLGTLGGNLGLFLGIFRNLNETRFK